MKVKTLIAPLACSIILLAGCGGDHSDKTVRDTAKNVHDSIPSNIDTSKTTTTTGGAGVDNSGSGGTKIAKPDSIKK